MRNFFAQVDPSILESQYWNTWEQIFTLKEYGRLSLFEQSMMSGEERAWYANRIKLEFERKAEAERKAAEKGKHKHPKISG